MERLPYRQELDTGRLPMKAIVVTDQVAGTAGMKLMERPEPRGALASLSGANPAIHYGVMDGAGPFSNRTHRVSKLRGVTRRIASLAMSLQKQTIGFTSRPIRSPFEVRATFPLGAPRRLGIRFVPVEG